MKQVSWKLQMISSSDNADNVTNFIIVLKISKNFENCRVILGNFLPPVHYSSIQTPSKIGSILKPMGSHVDSCIMIICCQTMSAAVAQSVRTFGEGYGFNIHHWQLCSIFAKNWRIVSSNRGREVYFSAFERNVLLCTPLTLLIPSYFRPTLYSKWGSSGPQVTHQHLVVQTSNFASIRDTLQSLRKHKFCKKNLLYAYHGNCLITWCFSLIIVKTSMKNR